VFAVNVSLNRSHIKTRADRFHLLPRSIEKIDLVEVDPDIPLCIRLGQPAIDASACRHEHLIADCVRVLDHCDHWRMDVAGYLGLKSRFDPRSFL